jgi:hypothetical protein
MRSHVLEEALKDGQQALQLRAVRVRVRRAPPWIGEGDNGQPRMAGEGVEARN